MSGVLLEGRRRPAPPIDDILRATESWALAGWNVNSPDVQKCIDAGLPALAGGAQGLNPAVFMNNVPSPGSYEINQQAFNLLTERNDVPGPSNPWPGFGGRIDQRIANVGVLSNIRLLVAMTIVVSGSGAVTSLYPFPYGMFKNVYLNANGGTALIRANGLDLHARRQRLFRNPAEYIATAPGMDTTATLGASTPYRPIGRMFNGVIPNGTYTIAFIVDLPIVHDPSSLTGALFAQSDQNYLNFVVETAQQADVFNVAAGGAVSISGNVASESTFFSIPSKDANNGRIVVLPQAVNWLHEFIATDNPFSNQGDVPTSLVRNNGQLLALYQYIDNGGATQISPSALSAIKWAYAGNQVPRNYNSTATLLEENQRDYNGLIEPGYFVLDFEKENWQRDGVYPRGLSELETIITIPGSVTVNANAHTHTVLETLTTS